MKKLLWVGDAGCPSGFARATHETLDIMRHSYDVTVLGLNYRGDPHNYPYEIWAAWPGGDPHGVGRLLWMCDQVKPDVIIIQNDPWNIPIYLDQLRGSVDHTKIPVIASLAVDGKNCGVAKLLNDLTLAIFWTQFGLNEARQGGYTGPAVVIPLGVDTDGYRPMDRSDARIRRKLKNEDLSLLDKFIVGNVNRNQPRKRWDLTIRYFARWIKEFDVKDAWLYLHVGPTGDRGVSVEQLCRYYGVVDGINDRLALIQPEVFYGAPEHEMVDTYNSFDVFMTTTQGEGMGLTTLEAMACGVPCILPDWAALGDWAKDAALMVPCTSTAIGPPYVNVIGGVPDEELFIQALDTLYRDELRRRELSEVGLKLTRDPKYRWSNIGRAFTEAVDCALMSNQVTV